MITTHLIMFKFTPGATATATAVSGAISGLEWTMPDARVHFTVDNQRLHWTAEEK